MKKKKNIVTIGGGTGSFTLLSGLKKYDINLSAIVSMADDGGSTGMLRDELGVLPPGDVRQCLVALSESSDILRELLNYRFEKGKLAGHNFGNLFLSALEKTSGSFSKGVKKAADILGVKGRVIPVSEEDMRLSVQLKNGEVIRGENQLDHNQEIQKTGLKKIFLKPKVKANKEALSVIKKADFVIIGPGDLYGSIAPNLLVAGISEAIQASRAKIIYICNLTNKKGQTEGFSLEDYVEKIDNFLGGNIINFVVFNKKIPSKELIKKYEKREGKKAIVSIKAKEKNKSYKIVQADILQTKKIISNKADKNAKGRSFIRHDSRKLAKAVMLITELNNYKNIIKNII